jgi:hypothetical protein
MKEKKTLFSVLLDKTDSARLKAIAESKQMTKSQAFREWVKNASRSIAVQQDKRV